MKNLIYTIAVGEKYLKMFEYWYQSLKKSSNLDNIEVWLFTDEAGKNNIESKNIANIKILLCTKHPYVLPAYNNVKFEIYRHIQNQDFNKIVYSDVDILINNINTVFESISADRVYAMHEEVCTAKNVNTDIWHFYKVYNQEEQQYLIKNNIALYCAGFFGFLANSRKVYTGFLNCLEVFDKVPTLKIINNRAKIIDQSAFNGILSLECLFSGDESIIAPFDEHLIKLPPFNNNFNYPVLHFIHPSKDVNLVKDKLEAMEIVFKNI